MNKINIEMNFCRRCGKALKHKEGVLYICDTGHAVFLNTSPSVGLVLLNDRDEILMLVRAIEPGLGLLDVPGGFCDGPETLEQAVHREIEEEIGLSPIDYSKPEFILSHIDPYDYKGETLPVLASIFIAKIITDKQPKAADDAASLEWISLSELDMDKVYFPAVRAGIEKAKQRL